MIAAAAASLGSLAIAVIAAAISGFSTDAVRSKKARDTGLSSTGNVNCDSLSSPAASW